MQLKISEILQATGGALLCGSEDVTVQSFFSDSRQAKPGGMFVPFPGERTDSHRFIGAVAQSGAAASFTERPLPDLDAHGLQDAGFPLVLVKDSRAALQRAAAHYRAGFDLPIVGVTGSVGKTTAKEMIALALSAGLRTLKTVGNQNSQIGVPLTVCRLTAADQAAVVEMGISMPGEMRRLAEVVRPGYAVVTNIGVSHIEFLKSRENILTEKLHIADFVPPEGTLFVNGDDDLLATVKASGRCRVVTFGVSQDCDWRAVSIRGGDNGQVFTCEAPGGRFEVFLPAAGVHNVRNALASLAVAHALGVEAQDAAQALAAYRPPAMRQQIVTLPGGATLIDDSYNASPDSMRGALDILADLTRRPAERSVPAQARRAIAVLGDMLELGDASESAHLEIGRYAARQNVDYLIAVGGFAGQLFRGFGGNHCTAVANAGEALEALRPMLRSDDVVLIKGSRGIHLDEVARGLTG